MSLYIISRPDGNVALLRLGELGEYPQRGARGLRLMPLRWSGPSDSRTPRTEIYDTPIEQCRVIAVSGLCGVVDEYEAAERLVEGEDVASDLLARPPVQGVSAFGGWFATPSDWPERCRAADVGWFGVAPTVTELRDRDHLCRPHFPSDRGAYDRVMQLLPRRPWW